MMIQTMKLIKRVNFEDCDPFSHLNNAQYLNYFLNAREEQLRTHKVLNIFEHSRKTGNSWAVISHDIRYMKPALLGEELEIWSRMLTFDTLRNLVEFVMVNPENGQLKAMMHTQFAYFSIRDAKPAKPDENLVRLFGEIALFPGTPLYSIKMEDRLKAVKQEILSES
ncbi:acyl-CoA thioesterase [Desulfospira joergensenii]|uniref:acyl-CoA thioesterase n=1 Tax=Desulfospira joergensenii TaxID=53329 RepID=UPI0013774902|nr:acyl-CoA thioesterase [Desulfospira joergensenii]